MRYIYYWHDELWRRKYNDVFLYIFRKCIGRHSDLQFLKKSCQILSIWSIWSLTCYYKVIMFQSYQTYYKGNKTSYVLRYFVFSFCRKCTFRRFFYGKYYLYILLFEFNTFNSCLLHQLPNWLSRQQLILRIQLGTSRNWLK